MRRYSDSHSDMGQESFVLNTLNETRNGYYVELGSGHPIDGNNTYLLETRFGWQGLAIDIDPVLAELYSSTRRNTCIAEDALLFNYEKYFVENNFPTSIDYLQIDIDGHDEGLCLLALIALPMLKYRFKVITIEHDIILNPARAPMRAAQQEILYKLGYKLCMEGDGEDWWVDSDVNIGQ